MDAVILAAKDNSLSIEVAEKGWTYYHLIDQEMVFLGADIASSLIYLRDWLCEDDPLDWRIQGKINGIPIVHLFLTSERHHVLYAGVDGEDGVLFWNNGTFDHSADEIIADGTNLETGVSSLIPLSGIMRLSPGHRQKWVEALTTILESL